MSHNAAHLDGDKAVATCLEEETRWENKCGLPVLTGFVCEWIASLEALPEDSRPAKRPGWWRHGMSLFGERSAPLDGVEGCWNTGACETEASIPPTIAPTMTRTAELDGPITHCFAPCKAKKEGCEPRDACDVLIPIQREKCERVGEAVRPDFRVFDAAHLQQCGRATCHDTQIRQMVGTRRCSAAQASSVASHHEGPRKRRTPTWWACTWTSSDCAWCTT